MSSKFSALQYAISPTRLRPYQQPKDSECQTIARYVWNACLCESLYGPLQHLEVTLRNALYRSISIYKRRDTPQWLDENSRWLFDKERDAIATAKSNLSRMGKSLTQDQLISELTMGFWTGLLRNDYEQDLWPRLVVSVFPQFAPNRRPRQVLSQRFTEIRHLRNRVFHHEPIWNRRTLQTEYDDLIEAIGWLNLSMMAVTQACGTFSEIYNRQQLLDLESILTAHV